MPNIPHPEHTKSKVVAENYPTRLLTLMQRTYINRGFMYRNMQE